MKRHRLFVLLNLFIFGCFAQDPTTPVSWNGDPKICIPDQVIPNPGDKPLPKFTNKAEFALELVEIRHVLDATLPSTMTMMQYLYDYDANKLIFIKNANGFIDVEFFYYEALRKSSYYRREFCVVSNIDKNRDFDGTSAIQLQNGTWHIRPLNEFLLFSSNDPRRPQIRPKYIGQSVVRSIPVDQWETCIVDKTNFVTTKRVWSFAQPGVVLPTGPVTDNAVPIQAIINTSISFPNGTEVVENDQIFNVYSYRPGIIETNDQLVPPKGVFCNSGPDQILLSLREAGAGWPNRFSVRIEASSSRLANWQKFHLFYDNGNEGRSRRIRYDFLPAGAEHFESVIHDYSDNLTYTIDRQLGTCKIARGVRFQELSPSRDPIGFFIHHERRIFQSEDRMYEINGFRQCRGNTIRCLSLTTSIEKFPAIIDPDTGTPTGETWEATNLEYGWSVRAPFSTPSESGRRFDYPAYMFLRLYRYGDPSNPSPFNIRTEDIEYEFYEMSYERHQTDFDTSVCYRSLGYEYLHLAFSLQLSIGNIIDGNHLDRRALEREIQRTLVDKSQVRFSRVTDVEVDHEEKNNDVMVHFTLLGRTPKPEAASGVDDSESTADQAKVSLQKAIDDGTFKFTMKLTDAAATDVQFTAVRDSLKSSKLFMSSHATGKKQTETSYTKSSIAGGIIGGILVGLAIGVIIAAVYRIVRKEPMPEVPFLKNTFSFSNPLPKISFHNTKPTNDIKSSSEKATTDA